MALANTFGYSLPIIRAVKSIPAREIPVEMSASREFDPASLKARIRVTGTLHDGDRIRHATRVLDFDDGQFTPEESRHLYFVLGRFVATALGAEIRAE